MSEVFVVGISWRTAPVAVREKLAAYQTIFDTH